MAVLSGCARAVHRHGRGLAALLTGVALLAGCGGPTGSPVPTVAPSGAASASPSVEAPSSASAPSTAPSAPMTSAAPAASATPSPSASGASATGPWQPAGSMHVARALTHAVLLSDGEALVVGNDSPNVGVAVRDDSATAELWDASTGAWKQTAGLNRPRGQFVAVGLQDGSVLVTGGLDRGNVSSGADTSSACFSSRAQSYSSTYLYDPRHGAWARVGLLDTARTDPSAVLLPDGRVLVAGGYYLSGATGSTAPDAVLAGYRPVPPASASAAPPADIAPSFTVAPLATAELFDPATGTWSTTGPMHYARFGAAMVTLRDGRVLIVGSAQGTSVSGGGEVEANDAALFTAELYDPRTDRFALTGGLPQRQPDRGTPYGATAGTLVALPDGGALLVANDLEWKHAGSDTRSFRYDVRTGTWSEVGKPFTVGWNYTTNTLEATAGVGGRLNALVAPLRDGRVLVAGGETFGQSGPGAARSAALFDPAANAWTALPPMPTARAGGAAVTLPDGSVLLVGGYNAQQSANAACNEPQGLTSAIRFVPTP